MSTYFINLFQLSSLGVKDILVIGGSPKKQEGPFSESMDLFQTGLFSKYVFTINIAGHPEGNPDDSESDLNLIEKSKWLFENKLNFSIVTQWTLDVEKTNKVGGSNNGNSSILFTIEILSLLLSVYYI